MQNHLIAIAILGLSLFSFTLRPSLGLLCLIAGGAWNLIDYLPDRVITDPFTLGNLAFNLADVAIFIGFLLETRKMWITGTKSRLLPPE